VSLVPSIVFGTMVILVSVIPFVYLYTLGCVCRVGLWTTGDAVGTWYSWSRALSLFYPLKCTVSIEYLKGLDLGPVWPWT